MNWRGGLTALAFICFCCRLQAQVAPPSSGDVTVRLIQGLDSATSRPGQVSAATVVKSTNPAVPPRSSAMVQLMPDQGGGFAVQLVRLSVNGQAMRTASSAAELAPDFLGKLRSRTRQPGAPQDSVSGARVFLPQDTLVKFTLAEPAPVQPRPSPGPVPQPEQPQAIPEAPSAWQPTPPPYGVRKAGDTAVSLAVIATRGTKRGRAHLILSCTNDSFLAAYFTVGQPLIGYKVDDFNNVAGPGDSTPLGRFQIADGAETQLTLSGNTGEDNPVKLNISSASRNGLPDNFYTADNAGKPAKLTILPPDGKGPPTVVNFVLPTDPAPMMGVASSCLLAQAREAAEVKAKIVASCPVKPGKALVDAKVRALPGGHSFDYEPSDESFGGVWDLSSPPMKAGQHAVLECIYAAPGTAPGSEPKVVAPANRMSITLPPNAASCGMGGEPLEVTCSRK